jgi:hypothetical protein
MQSPVADAADGLAAALRLELGRRDELLAALHVVQSRCIFLYKVSRRRGAVRQSRVVSEKRGSASTVADRPLHLNRCELTLGTALMQTILRVRCSN